jgi:ribosomal protein L37E
MPGDYRRPTKTTGLDWSTLKPRCTSCGKADSSVHVETGQCATCAAPPAPAPAPKTRNPRRGRRRATERATGSRRRAAQYPRAIGPRRRPGRPPIERAGRPIGLPRETRSDKIQLDGPAIAEAYQAGRTLRELADEHDVSSPTIARVLDEQGVVRRKQRVVYDETLIENVRRLYVDDHLDQAQVADRLGITTKVVQTAMARGDITPRESASARSQRGIGHPIKITPNIAQEILTRYTAGEAGPQIAKAFDVSAASIYHLLNKHGIARHGRRTPGLGHDGSIGLKARIADLGVTPHVINRWALEVGLLDMPKPGLPSAATVDAWEDAHTEAAS